MPYLEMLTKKWDLRERRPSRHDKVRRACNLVPWIEILATSIITFMALRLSPTDAQCFRRTFSWSPAAHVLEYKWKTFDNIDLFNVPKTYFDLNQTRELETAWEDLLPVHPIAIPESQLSTLGYPSYGHDWVRDPTDSESILALPEVFVQLGCINLLRQIGYSNEYNYSRLASFRGGQDRIWDRAHQCLERLRQSVMCWADSSSVFQETDPHPRPGQEGRSILRMDTYHRCRNFDKIKKWTGDNRVGGVTMNNLWWGGDTIVTEN